MKEMLIILFILSLIVLLILSGWLVWQSVKRFIPIRNLEPMIKAAARQLSLSEDMVRDFYTDNPILKEAESHAGRKICFFRGYGAYANGKRVMLSTSFMYECLAFSTLREGNTYLYYTVMHECAHLKYDGRCRYRLMPTSKAKFYNWISEVRADFSAAEGQHERVANAILLVKRAASVNIPKRLIKDDHHHPSWVRRIQYLNEFNMFAPDLWKKIAHDCGYHITLDDIAKINATNSKGNLERSRRA